MKTIKLEWKAFKVNSHLVQDELKQLIPNVLAISENSVLEIHCSDDLSEQEEADIRAHWDAIDEESEAATSFKSREEQKAEKEQKKASGRAKLLALGLSEDEVKALLGA